MLLSLILAVAPLPTFEPFRDVASDGKRAWLLLESEKVIRLELATAERTERQLEPGRRVDAHHLEQAERVVRSRDGARLFVVWQSRNAGPLRGSVTELDPTTLAPRGARWTFSLEAVPDGGPVVRGEVRVDPDTRLLVARVDDEKNHAALFASPLSKTPGELRPRFVTTLDGPMNGGSQFLLVSDDRGHDVVGTTGSSAQVIAMKEDGTLDARFGDGGLARVPEIGSLGGLVADRSGWIVTGSGGSGIVAARFLADGRRDRAFNSEPFHLREGWLEHNPCSAAFSERVGVVVASYEKQEAVLRAAVVGLDEEGKRRSSRPIEVRAALQLRVLGLFVANGELWAAVNVPAGNLLSLGRR